MTKEMTDMARSPAAVPCPVCRSPLSLRSARGRKSGKASLMLICPRDGRHFRGFITDRTFVAQVLARLEGQALNSEGSGDLEAMPEDERRSTTNLERGSGS